MVSQEKIVVFRRVWKSGKGKYVIAIPQEIVEHYKLEGKLVKAILEEVPESEHNSSG